MCTYECYSPKRSPTVIVYSDDGVSYVRVGCTSMSMSDSTILFTANRTHKLQQGVKRTRKVSYNSSYCRSFGRVSAVRLRWSSAAREYLGNGRPSGHSAGPTLPGRRSKPVGTAAWRENQNPVSIGGREMDRREKEKRIQFWKMKQKNL
jgi:hypothetical protein